MAKALDPTNGFIVHGWMVTHLHLQGYELAIYAIVHQFSQSKAGIYTGGVPYVMKWLGCSDVTARKYLHQLEDKDLIRSISGDRDGVPFRNYEVTDNHIPKNFGDIPKNIGVDTQEFCLDTPKNFGVNNKYNNKIDNNTPPTPSEVEAYCRARGWSDPAGFADYYIAWQNNAGWKTKTGKRIENWKQNVLVWERNHKTETFAKQPQKKLRQMTEAEYLESLKK